MRVLFIIILLAVSFLVIKSFKRKLELRRLNQNKHKDIGNIIKCHVCGLHIPEKEATITRGKHYCSLEHANQDSLPPAD
jgi:uncharacterized protein